MGAAHPDCSFAYALQQRTRSAACGRDCLFRDIFASCRVNNRSNGIPGTSWSQPAPARRDFSSLATTLPGVLEWKGSSGILNPSDLVLSNSFSITGIVAVVVLLFSATSVMRAMKSSIRAMFGIDQVPYGVAMEKLRDLLGFAAIAVGVGATGVLTLAHTVIGTQIFSALGVESVFASAMIRIGSFLISATIDGLILWVLIRFVALVRVPRVDLIWGLAIFGLISTLIRSLGTSVVGAVTNPLLASLRLSPRCCCGLTYSRE